MTAPSLYYDDAVQKRLLTARMHRIV